MTVPDPTTEAQPVEDVIAEALSWLSGEMTRWSPTAHPDHNRWSWRGDGHGEATRAEYRRQAAELVAAIRSMTVAQLAELIGGTVERSDTCAECAERGIECDRSARAVGPWGAPS